MNYPEQKREIIDGISYDYLCNIQEVNCKGLVYPAHYHNYIEILYGIKGTYDVLLNGIHYIFSQGDMIIINSKEVHQINSNSSDGGEYIVLRFEPEIIYNNMFHNYLELQYILPFILNNSQHQKVIQGKDIESTFIPSLFYDILDEFHTKKYGYELAVKNHIGRIFLWILRYFHQSGTTFSIASNDYVEVIKRLQPALDYVLDHYTEELKATDMARLCSMSSSYFSRTFNRQLNMSFNEYVNQIRIMEAEKLLVSSTLNITEISSNVGFSTTSYFIKLFKSYKKISPKEFRKEFATER